MSDWFTHINSDLIWHLRPPVAVGQRARSLMLAGIMFLSVLTGMLMLDLSTDQEGVGNELPIVSGSSGSEFSQGGIGFILLSVSDEDLASVEVDVRIDGSPAEGFVLDEYGILQGNLPTTDPGVKLVEVEVTDKEGESGMWSGTFTVLPAPVSGPEIMVGGPLAAEEGSSVMLAGTVEYHNPSACSMTWQEVEGSSGSLPVTIMEDGRFHEDIEGDVGTVTIRLSVSCDDFSQTTDVEATWLESSEVMGCTDEEADNFDSSATEDDGSCVYPDSEPDVTYDSSDLGQFWIDKFLCQNGSGVEVDDYNTSGHDSHVCGVSVAIDGDNVTITMNGLPNHDLESGPGCCASSQNYVLSVPRSPTNDTEGGHNDANCPEAGGAYECAADRGEIAYALNGVPIFGPEDGPGGDAVASHHGVYEEDRQEIWLGLCHGHSGPGGVYHYHADANCIHWHTDESEDASWLDYSFPSSAYTGSSSPVIGVAFDGYPIYGVYGEDATGQVAEMKSSYRLKEGETGYNGIDDYEYDEELGDLDVCNGHFGPTPDFPDGIYHYHSTIENGMGDMGFPYFLICYHGIVPNAVDGGGDPCAGYGETWGPGIGPPPEGCGQGQQAGQEAPVESGLGDLPPPPGGGVIWILILAGIGISIRFKEEASWRGPRDPAGIAPVYRQARELA